MAYTYCLSYKSTSTKYEDRNKIEDVDLSKLDCVRGYFFDTLEFIDAFTGSFKSKNELLTFLKDNDVIDKQVSDLFITLKREKKDIKGNVVSSKNMGVIFDGNNLMFDADYNLLNGKFVVNWIEKHKKSPILIKVLKFYRDKYGDNIPINLENMLIDMIARVNIIQNNDILSLDAEVKADESLEKFKNQFLTMDKEKNIKESYREIHDLINFIKKYDKDVELYKTLLGNSKNRFNLYYNGEYPVNRRDYEYSSEDHEEFMIEEELENGRLRRM